jgi:two-component system, chemotaxis family, sensor kinase Cph1
MDDKVPIDNLRLKAEKLLRTREPIVVPEDVNSLIHDLQVHQIELELQNEELKKSQIELEEYAKKYSDLYNFAPVGYFTFDEKGMIIDVNQTGASLLGVPKSNLINFAFIPFIAPDSRQIFYQHSKKVIETGEKQICELKLLNKDSKEFFGQLVTRMEDNDQGNSKKLRSNLIDVTKRKQAEIKLNKTLDNLEELVEERTKELLLANDYNRNLLETSLDPLVTIGPDGKITDVNRATEEVTGYPREELIGTDFANYFTNPVEAENGYQQVFQEGLVRDYPLQIKHKNGNLTSVLYNASVYKDESGEVVGVFAAARDINELKKAEEDLREYWESLEELVKLRTEELAKSNADLKQFTYVTSHDLREPLRMITSFLQLLERRYKDQLDQDANEFIAYAVDGAKRLDSMIKDLLEYSRVANKKIQFTDVDLEQVLQQITSNLNILINENKTSLSYDQLPIIRGDKNQMILLFQNLISNAIKYRLDEAPQIHISSKKDEDNFIFAVKDNGMGIDPQHLERIFTIFQRLHNHDEYEGSGIGLSIAQRIVHQHGGEIWAESEPGKGSTFYFTIPNKFIVS